VSAGTGVDATFQRMVAHRGEWRAVVHRERCRYQWNTREIECTVGGRGASRSAASWIKEEID
jgi:hypothetical protein